MRDSAGGVYFMSLGIAIVILAKFEFEANTQMTQELIDLRNSILQGNYTEALAIVDELEGMSKQANIRQIQSFLKILLMHQYASLIFTVIL